MAVTYHDHLPNKPLVETILEVKWGAPDRPDPAYPMIVGRLYERVRDEYAEVEDLPLAQLPAVVAVQVPRHRFRVAKGQWPLVQIGPGVAALNDTEGYSWRTFRDRALDFFPHLKCAHPQPDEMPITSLRLEYIDAVEFDFSEADLRSFLRDKLHISVGLPETVFEGQPVDNRPKQAVVQLAFPTRAPAGLMQLSVRTGTHEGQPAVIINTSVSSAEADAVAGWHAPAVWLDAAHGLIRHWFFALVQGDLLQEFLRT